MLVHFFSGVIKVQNLEHSNMPMISTTYVTFFLNIGPFFEHSNDINSLRPFLNIGGFEHCSDINDLAVFLNIGGFEHSSVVMRPA